MVNGTLECTQNDDGMKWTNGTTEKKQKKNFWDLFTNGLTWFNSFVFGFYMTVAKISAHFTDDSRFDDGDDDDDDDYDMQNGSETTIYI